MPMDLSDFYEIGVLNKEESYCDICIQVNLFVI